MASAPVWPAQDPVFVADFIIRQRINQLIDDRDRKPHLFYTEEQAIRLLDAMRPLGKQPIA